MAQSGVQSEPTENGVVYVTKMTNTLQTVGVDIPVAKTITGNSYTGNETFNVTLTKGTATDSSNAVIPDTVNKSQITVGTLSLNKDGTSRSFRVDGYTQPGTYTYTITETPSGIPGMDDAEPQTVTVEVAYNDATNPTGLTAAVTSSNSNPVTITNTYQIAAANLAVNKTIAVTPAGTTVPSETYTFVLTDSANNEIEQKTVTGNGAVTFSPITYTLNDWTNGTPVEDDSNSKTITYTITEVPGSTVGMRYDSKTVTATVTLTKNPTTGALSVSPAAYTDNDSDDTNSADTFTNHYDLVDVQVTKTWDDSPLTNASHPAVSFTLSASPAVAIANAEQTLAADAAAGTPVSWTGLPKYTYVSGAPVEITYSVTEANVTGYTSGTITAAQGNAYSFTAPNTLDTGTLNISKSVYVNNADRTSENTNTDFYVKVLYTDKQGNTWYMSNSSGTLTKGASGATEADRLAAATVIFSTTGTGLSFSNMPTGIYTVYEVDASGSALTASTAPAVGVAAWSADLSRTEAEVELEKNGTETAQIINKYTSGTYNMAVTKQWNDDNNRDGLRPASLVVQLQRKISTDGDSWTPVTNLNTGVTYSDNTSTASGLSYLTLNEGNGWSAVAVDQAETDGNGNRYTYRWVEGTVDAGGTFTAGVPAGYTQNPSDPVPVESSSAAGKVYLTKLVNEYTPETVNVKAYKVWNDSHNGTANYDGLRTAVTFRLEGTYTVGTGADAKTYNASVADAEKTIIELNATNQYAEWNNLPKYHDGHEITYKVTEVNVPAGYTAAYFSDSGCGASNSVDNGVLTNNGPTTNLWEVYIQNTHTPNTVTINATKVWAGEDLDGDNTADFTALRSQVSLTLAGTYTDSNDQQQTVTISTANHPEGATVPIAVDTSVSQQNVTWTGLLEYVDGHKVTYTVAETTPDSDYTPTVTNISYSPANANHVVTGTVTVTNTLKKGSLQLFKAFAFTGAPVDVSSLNGLSFEITTTEIGGTKYYLSKDANGSAVLSTQPSSFAYPTAFTDGYLSVANVPVGHYTITESGAAGLITGYTLNSVQADNTTLTAADGKYSHTITINENTTAQPHFTNTYEQDKVTVTATKNWVDSDNDYNLRTPVTLRLAGSYTETEGEMPKYISDTNSTAYAQTLALNNSTNAVTWPDLPKYYNGHLITYQVVEDAVPAGYAVSYASGSEGSLLTNGTVVFAENDTTGRVTVTNTLQNNGKISLTKNVTVNGGTAGVAANTYLVDGNYTFTLTGPEPSTTARTVTVTVSGGTANAATVTDEVTGETTTETVTSPVTINVAGGVATISGLIPGAYTLKENSSTNGTELASITRGDNNASAVNGSAIRLVVTSDAAAAQTATAAFTNNVNTGSLKIQKHVTGTNANDKPFTISVALTAPTGQAFERTYLGQLKSNGSDTATNVVFLVNSTGATSAVTGYVEITDGMTVASIPEGITNGTITSHALSLKKDEWIQIDGLPEGTTYLVSESIPEGQEEYYNYTFNDTTYGYNSGTHTGFNDTLSGANDIKTATLNNVYTAYGKEDFEVTKKLHGRDFLPNDLFTFELHANDNGDGKLISRRSVKVVSVSDDGDTVGYVRIRRDGTTEMDTSPISVNGVKTGGITHIELPDIEFDETHLDTVHANEDGTYTYYYYMTEVRGTDTAIQYDSTAHVLKLTLQDLGNGHIHVMDVYDNNPTQEGKTEAEFTNIFKTISAKATKKWDDDTDADAKRPKFIELELFRNNVKVPNSEYFWIPTKKEYATSAEFQAKATAAGLGNYYHHIEVEPDGTISYDVDFNGKNHKVKYTWSTPENATEPVCTIEVDNLAVYTDTGSEYTYTWHEVYTTDLRQADYGLTDLENDNYTDSVTTTLENGYILTSIENGLDADGWNTTINNKYEPESVTLTAMKVWDDEGDADGFRPDSITISLYKEVRGVVTKVKDYTVEMNATDNWTFTTEPLPRHEDGVEVKYTLSEDEANVPAHYTFKGVEQEMGGKVFVFTNEHEPVKTAASVTKIWNDESNRDGKRPDHIDVKLLANGKLFRTVRISGTGDTWTHTENDLPRYQNGTEIRYTWEEYGLTEGYAAEQSGNTITNNRDIERIDIPVTKVWNDQNDQDGLRPERISVILMGDGRAVRTYSLTAAEGWKHTFTGLPRYAEGKVGVEVNYSVEEITGLNYDAVITGNAGEGFTVTNTHRIVTTDVNGVKTWADNNNEDGLRPDHIVIRLHADGTEIDRAFVTAADGWKWGFTGLDKFRDHGVEIRYTITEDEVEGYDSEINGFDVTNTHEHVTTEAAVTKVWKDDNDHDGKRPATVTMVLYRNNTATATTVTLPARADAAAPQQENVTFTHNGDSWTATVSNLPKYDGKGDIISYSWNEKTDDLPKGYSIEKVEKTETDGKVSTAITNVYEPEYKYLTVQKAWEDGNNQDGLRQPVTVKLFADGADTGKSVTLSERGGWLGTIEELPVYNADGTEIRYSWYEDALDGYNGGQALTVEVTDREIVTLTNVHEPEKTEVFVTKVWDDANDQDGKRPERITVVLLADGEAVQRKVLTKADLDIDGNWSYVFENLPRFSGTTTPIRYTVEENGVPADYELQLPIEGDAETGFIITNKHTPETTSATVKKVWDDQDDQDGLRPKELKATLTNGMGLKREVMLNEGNRWTAVVEGLPVYSGGERITYTWTEDPVEGYTLVNDPDAIVQTVAGMITTLTNRHEVKQTEAVVQKVWIDKDDVNGLRPDSIEVLLLADGETIASRTLNRENRWTAKAEDLPTMKNGKEITYTWQEADAPGCYKAETEKDDTGTVTTITNTLRTGELSVKKTVSGVNAGDKKFTFTITASDGRYVKQDGTLTNTRTIYSMTAGQTLTIKDAPIGRYTVTELGTEAGGDAWIRNYTLIASQSGSGTVTETTPGAVELRNAYIKEMGKLTIVKSFEGIKEEEYPELKNLTFRVTGPNDFRKDVKYSEFKNGVYTFEEELPIGSYFVHESNADYLSKGLTLEKDSVTTQTVKVTKTDPGVATLKNRYSAATTTAMVMKVWDDDKNRDGSRPESVTVVLMKNGKATEKKFILNEENSWTAEASGLQAFEGDTPVTYSWGEQRVNGYALASIKTAGNLTILTNKHTPQYTALTVRKVWDDQNNKNGLRPAYIIMKLSSESGGTLREVKLSDENNWSYTIKTTDPNPLPKYDEKGNLIIYKWSEQSVLGYVQTSAITVSNVTVFTNQYRPAANSTISVSARATVNISTVRKPVPTPTPNPAVQIEQVIVNQIGDCCD